jgi:hypothetical protein
MISPSVVIGFDIPPVPSPCSTHVFVDSHKYQRFPLVASVSIYASPTAHDAGNVVLLGTRNVTEDKS